MRLNYFQKWEKLDHIHLQKFTFVLNRWKIKRFLFSELCNFFPIYPTCNVPHLLHFRKSPCNASLCWTPCIYVLNWLFNYFSSSLLIRVIDFYLRINEVTNHRNLLFRNYSSSAVPILFAFYRSLKYFRLVVSVFVRSIWIIHFIIYYNIQLYILQLKLNFCFGSGVCKNTLMSICLCLFIECH